MIEDIAVIIGILAVIAVISYSIYRFIKLEKAKQLEIIMEWLTYAVMRAEKELGSGTGQLKLRYVYDLFLNKFKYLSLVISFPQFSRLVDQALISMKDFLGESEKLKDYISNKE